MRRAEENGAITVPEGNEQGAAIRELTGGRSVPDEPVPDGDGNTKYNSEDPHKGHDHTFFIQHTRDVFADWRPPRGWWTAAVQSRIGATRQGATEACTMLAATAPRSTRCMPERAWVVRATSPAGR